MSRALLAALTFVSVAVVLGVWFVGRGPRAPAVALAVPAPQDTGAGARAGGDANAPLLREPHGAASAPAPQTELLGNAGARRAQGDAPPEGPPIELAAVAHDTREGLAGTVFHWAPASAARTYWDGEFDADAADVEQVLERIGHEVVSDELGLAEVPWPGEPLALVARNEGDFAAQLIGDYDAGPIEIELFPDLSLAIQTLTPDGAPIAGVPVGLFRMRGDGSGERSVWTSVTEGERAIAEMRHALFRLRGEVERFDLYAALDTLTAENPTRPLDLEDWPSEPLALTLPALGGVLVRLAGEDGTLPPGSVTVDLRLADDQGREIQLADGGAGRRVELETETGSALFEHVGLGLQLRVRARSVWATAGEIEVPGPMSAGEVITLALPLGESHPGVRVRVLDEEGLPLVRRSLEARLIRMSNSYAAKSLREETDDEGRLHVPIRLGPGKQRTLRLTLLDEAGAPLRRAEVDLNRELPAGTTDLGDVELQELPTVVEGVVVNSDGWPVSQAKLTVRASARPGRWDTVPRLQANSDELGRFEIRGDAPVGGWLRLHATKRAHTPAEPIEFRPGARGVEVLLDRSGALAGSVILRDGVPFRDVIVATLTSPDGDKWSVQQSARLLRSGTFQIDDLPAGAYAVQVRRAGDPVPMWEAFGIAVSGGDVTYDPRLQEIDLRQALFSIRVEVLDHRLRPLSTGRVRVFSQSQDTRSSSVAYAIQDGIAQVVSRERSHDLEIASEGYITVRLRGVDSDQQVVLQPAIRVRLQLPKDVRLPDPPLALRAMLVPDMTGTGKRSRELERQSVSIYRDGLRVGRQHPFLVGDEPVFDEGRIVELVVRDPGRQILDFALVRRAGKGRYRGVQAIDPPKSRRWLTVTPTDHGRVYRVQPDPARYKDALKKKR